MVIKNVLIYVPVILIVFLMQSFFWVPTYEEQVSGNSTRLVKYVLGSSGDAQILNPILSADTSSSSINDLVFDGLIDLDENLKYRPRLAKSWSQYEEVYLAINLSRPLRGMNIAKNADDWAAMLLDAMSENIEWKNNLRSIEVITEETIQGEIESIDYTLKQPPRLKFNLNNINQDFFKPIKKLLGENYFNQFPFENFIKAKNLNQQGDLEKQYNNILPVTEHNPVIIFDLREDVIFHDGHGFDSGDVLFTYNSIINPKGTSPRKSDYEPVKSAEIIGPYKIKFTYKRLFSPAFGSWTMGILPEHLLNKNKLKQEAIQRSREPEQFIMRDSNFGRNPIGTGPYKFVEWTSDEAISLVRNENYWEGPPEFEEYIMRIIPDPLTQEMEFYTGALDNYSVQPHQVSRFAIHFLPRQK